jgi:hypothetical protein
MQFLQNIEISFLMKTRELKISKTFFLYFTIFKFTRKRKVDEEDIQKDSQF